MPPSNDCTSCLGCQQKDTQLFPKGQALIKQFCTSLCLPFPQNCARLRPILAPPSTSPGLQSEKAEGCPLEGPSWALCHAPTFRSLGRDKGLQIHLL